MSIAQKLIAQGREEGRAEGREEGLEMGYGQGVLKTCLRLVQRKWGSVSEETVAEIEALPYARLEQLSEDLLDMVTVADLQGWLQAQAGA